MLRICIKYKQIIVSSLKLEKLVFTNISNAILILYKYPFD